ncbi:MAG: penicillin-binding protein 2, partial [Vicingaceae bacterium]
MSSVNPNKDIAWRLYLVYFFCCLLGFAVVGKVIWIQWYEGDELRAKSEKMTVSNKTIKAVRGNIYASDGSLLATSVPKYEVRFDVNTDALSEEIFNENIDSLSYCLSRLWAKKSSSEYRNELIAARKSRTRSGSKGGRYHLIGRNISYKDLKSLKSFPIFRNGQYKGGFIYIQQNKREKPFKLLAERTIGYKRSQVAVGLEGAYNRELSGVDGKRLMQKIAGGDWKPLNDDNEIEPQNGYDLLTSIDINLQDVAENALLKQLSMHGADHGCVVLMEVKTGEIKAIANLKRNKRGGYFEGYNYAIGESTEPGSTFKLPVLIAAFEDGYIDLDTEIDTEHGEKKFYDQTMFDTHDYGKLDVKRAFEVSSNIAVAKIITEHYNSDPQRFVDHLHRMNLNNKLGIEIKGEGVPQIKGPKSKTWSGVSLPWMAHGYEVLMTPLQILTFYNAVANDGVMVKPKFVKAVTSKGKVVKEMPTEVINERICSKETLMKVRSMLEGVVNNNGTAANLKNKHYKVAGKTGTAQIAKDR